MRIEEQLRNLARDMEQQQVPVALDDIAPGIANLGENDHSGTSRSRSHWMAMVAATVVVLAGVGALAWWAADDSAPMAPVDTGAPDTNPTGTTTPPTSTTPSTTTEDREAPDPEEARRLPLPFIDEPTNVYRDDALWWMPAELPDGYEYLWSEDYLNGERELYYVSTDAPTDRDFSPRDPNVDVINIWVLPDGAPVRDWQTSLADGTREQVTVNGEIWLLGFRSLSRVINGQLVTVSARTAEVALEVVEQLEQLPETEFERAPYRYENRVVVASLPAELGDGETPIEMTAASDGLTVNVDGQGPSFPTDEPVRFVAMVTSPSDRGGLTTLSAVTRPDVATVDFVHANGDIITIEPTDLSGRFELGFMLLKIGTLDKRAANDPIISRSTQVVIARDADGNVLAEIRDPF